MSTETEIKVKIDDPNGFCRKLESLNPKILSLRHFEDNRLLDFPDGRLGSSRCLLRIRYASGLAFLTYKGPPRDTGVFKTREELETRLEDGATTLHILELLGMRICFRYQKFRREFAVCNVHVAVDETPIGNYSEFEGSEEEIRDLTRKMGIAESEFLRLSYFSLYLNYCREKGEDPSSMVF